MVAGETHISLHMHLARPGVWSYAITPDFKLRKTHCGKKLLQDYPHRQEGELSTTTSWRRNHFRSYHIFRRTPWWRYKTLQPTGSGIETTCPKISNQALYKTFAGGGSKFSRWVDFKFAGTWRLSRLSKIC